MIVKIIGALTIVTGCGAYGYFSAYSERKEAEQLRNLLHMIDRIKSELQHNCPALGTIIRKIATDRNDPVHVLFRDLADMLAQHISPNVAQCMESALENQPALTAKMRAAARLLGSSLGCYGLQLQLKGISSVRDTLSQELKQIREAQKERHRCMQTLWLCAGAALAILLV